MPQSKDQKKPSGMRFELEPGKFCFTPGGFEVHLSIPDEDPATHSEWVVSARDVRLQ